MNELKMNDIKWEDFAKNISDYTGVEIDEISKETDLYSDLCMDSLGMFSMGMYLTNIYKLEVPLSSVALIETVGDMYDLLVKEGVPIKEA